MSRLDLSTLSIPDAQLIQRGLAATGRYTHGTFFGVPGPKTQAAYDAYRSGAAPGEASAALPTRGALPWMTEAGRWIGVREIKGSKHHPQIVSWWERTKQSFRDDETPWCAAFVGGVLEECGIESTRSAAARSYERWGTKLSAPAYGAVTVFWRGSRNGWQGHVAFLVGVTKSGDLLCLGGNQSDAVTVAKFGRDRLLGFRWPAGDWPRHAPLTLSGPASYSTGEA